MNEEEHSELVKVGDSFYDQLGILVAEHVAKMPLHLESETLMFLQDKCSVYSVCYEGVLADLRKDQTLLKFLGENHE